MNINAITANSVSFDAEKKTARCPYAIWRKVTCCDNPKLLDKLSQIDYLLAYQKVLDDIHDDNSLGAKIVEQLMRKKYTDIAQTVPELDISIRDGMEAISAAESKNVCIGIDIREA